MITSNAAIPAAAMPASQPALEPVDESTVGVGAMVGSGVLIGAWVEVGEETKAIPVAVGGAVSAVLAPTTGVHRARVGMGVRVGLVSGVALSTNVS